MAVPSSSNGTVEREMTIHQRGLVDTCFEEGQYEAGIRVLDQLRSRKYKPFPPHIRQLIYIALYPPASDPEDQPMEEFPTDPARASPSKFLSRQQSQFSLSPTPAAVEAARNLLFAFAHTNTPEILFRALPRSVGYNGAVLDAVDDDSFVSREAACIRDTRNVWEILRENFLQRRTDAAAPRKKARNRRRAAGDNRDFEDDSDSLTGPVGQQAWPILEWLLIIMEKDERRTQTLYSPLLLSQISPSKSSSGARWDLDAPLDIVFHTLQTSAPRRRALGLRLLILLVNLTSTTLVDLPMFLNAVSDRVLSLPFDDLTALFGALPATRPALHFRLALCKRYLARSSSTDAEKSRARPKPLQRGQPPNAPSDPTENAQDPSSGAEAASVARQYLPTSSVEILRLVSEPQPSNDMVARIKMELVLVYWMLQKQSGDAGDTDWQDILSSGKLSEAFGGDIAPVSGGIGPGGAYSALLTAITVR
ncbi:hypothetical protein OBBRIDRAFT_721153 [Obba rivulosa]|uniref:Uncharacterized protein n=1 Tax=Obba rivulosa TaxID=1052685 RepID=A0A8E2DT47_9APHY|nr:hypothetical protein OBBRIDRAFT_721153 [Obba rivulosa]